MEQTETNFIFNHILMRYGDGIISAKDSDLIDLEGSRAFPIDVTLLSDHDAPWAEVISAEYLEAVKAPQTKLMLTTKFAPHLDVGDLIFCESEWGGLRREFKIVQLKHYIGRWQTMLGARPTGRFPFEWSMEASFDIERGADSFVRTVGWRQGYPVIPDFSIDAIEILFYSDIGESDEIESTDSRYNIGDQTLAEIFTLENFVENGSSGTVDIRVDVSGVTGAELNERRRYFLALQVAQ